MADYVLDTHTCVFALAKPTKLGRKAKQALESVESGASIGWIPAAVAAEIVLLYELGRTDIGLAQLEDAMEAAPSLKFLPLDLQQIREFVAHAGIRDPFDRLIISAARATNARLVTRDEKLSETNLVQVVWS
jgi:PIN domain nuclease of toxin-antitoxin system